MVSVVLAITAGHDGSLDRSLVKAASLPLALIMNLVFPVETRAEKPRLTRCRGGMGDRPRTQSPGSSSPGIPGKRPAVWPSAPMPR